MCHLKGFAFLNFSKISDIVCLECVFITSVSTLRMDMYASSQIPKQFHLGIMCKLLSLALLLVLSGASLGLPETNKYPENSTCPTWTTYDYSTNSCKCGKDIHQIVHCIHLDECPNNFEVSVLYGFCMTLNEDQTKAVVGSCPFSIKRFLYWDPRLIVPNDTSQLDKAVCRYTQRTGQLCGQCVNGTSPPVYSYYPQCVHCPAGTNNWAKYLAVSVLPTTLFFFGTVVIKFRAASPLMNGYIMFCQIVASPNILRHVAEIYYIHPHQQSITTGIYMSFLSIWNLDFFRMLYPPFCLHPNTSTLQTLSLDYITAAYPLVLIILTYTLVTLHYHNCRLVVCLWRPFFKCCIRFQRQWDIRNSLVDAFVTFLLLSYVKLLSVSFDILIPTIMWDSRKLKQPTVLYYNGTVKYFSKEHLSYAIPAITILLVCIFLPILLLCLYPCRCFQRLLNRCNFRCQALHTFMDAFQGCYKNGTNGTRDCRYFAALYLITRVAVHTSLAFSSVSFTNSVFVAVLAVIVFLLSYIHPYKKTIHNQLDIFFFLVILVGLSSLWIFQGNSTNLAESFDKVILWLVMPIPIMYPLCLVLYHIWKKSRRFQSATEWIRVFFSRSEQHRNWAESLPRRVILNETSGLLKRNRQSVP